MTIDYVHTRLESADFSCDDVQIHHVLGNEKLSKLFRYELGVVTTTGAGLPLGDVIGAQVTLVFERGPTEVRRVHGMIAEVDERLDLPGPARAYELVLVPRAHRLTLVETQQIFLDFTVPEIISHKLEAVGLGADDYALRLMGSYPKREFVVQYKESDLAFVSRLAEHLGISFSFEHDAGHDTIVFSDHQNGFADLGSALLRKSGDKRDIFRLAAKTKVIPSTYAVQDYNYRTPQVPLSESVELSHPDCMGGVVEHGGHFKTPGDGQTLAQIRADERQATRLVYRGTSDLAHFAAGGRFTLDGPHDLAQPEMLITWVEHRSAQPVAAFAGSPSEPHYENTFATVPGLQTFRPPRDTPRPRIYGMINATIEHDIDEGVERWAQLDEMGRYTARFFFDTSVHEGKQSRWIRMLQPHVGANYGIHFPLKPGMEVLMAFIDGDPDRPLIVGSVYRPDTPSPVRTDGADGGLKNATINKIKSESGVIIEIHDA